MILLFMVPAQLAWPMLSAWRREAIVGSGWSTSPAAIASMARGHRGTFDDFIDKRIEDLKLTCLDDDMICFYYIHIILRCDLDISLMIFSSSDKIRYMYDLILV